jgi:hypothetical protein
LQRGAQEAHADRTFLIVRPGRAVYLVSAMATRTIELDRNDLDKSIDVLSSAAEALRLTRFERFSYSALMISVDIALVTFIATNIFFILASWFSGQWWDAFGASIIVLLVSIFVAIVSLALNIPLFRRAFRERARLKELGLGSLSRSLWKESRRSRWVARARGVLLLGAGIYVFLIVVLMSLLLIGSMLSTEPEPDPSGRLGGFIITLTFAAIAALMFAARYLRNQRERIELTANAEELRKALQSLRQRAEDAGVVPVPSELLEQTAKIESAQIAKERRDAVLQSITSPAKEYAVAFDRSAIEQRATLDIADRMELEDLVEHLGAEATEPNAGTGTVVSLRAVTKSKRVEIEYVIDRASRRIRINTVRQREGGPDTSANGAGHA